MARRRKKRAEKVEEDKKVEGVEEKRHLPPLPI
jgi:hypothetical protein